MGVRDVNFDGIKWAMLQWDGLYVSAQLRTNLKLDPKNQQEQILCLLLKRFLFVSSSTTQVLVLFLWNFLFDLHS